MLSQGKDDNEAGREKDKQETAHINAREYNTRKSLWIHGSFGILYESGFLILGNTV